MATAVAPPAAPPPTSATIRSLTAAGNHAAALRALSSLSASSSPLDHFALPPAIKSAAALRDARAACALHGAALRRALLHRPGPAVANALLTAYARCGDLDAALTLFAATPPELRDAVSYNSLISALCLFRRWEHALDALRAMLDEGRHAISSFTLVSVLLACSHLAADHRLGREAHAFALKNGFLDHRLGNERVANARRVFDMVPEPGRQLGMWNAMICGYAQAGMDQEALELFARMEGEAGCAPSETTMVGVLPACACSEAFTGKEAVHGYVVKRGMAGNQFFRNALMDMYARLGEMYGRLQPWAPPSVGSDGASGGRAGAMAPPMQEIFLKDPLYNMWIDP